MDAIATMAGQLQSRRQYPRGEENGSRAGRMRAVLRQGGKYSARQLAAVAGLADSGLVSALLKWDIGRGRVLFEAGNYSWNDSEAMPPPAPEDGRAALRETLEWHEIAEDDFPDADLTVIVRTRGCEEPVWLGYHDGEQWRDVDNLPIDVVRWAELPAGGDE